MGCNGSKGISVSEVDSGGFPTSKEDDIEFESNGETPKFVKRKDAKGFAFEVPINDSQNDNIIKKHPPKRFQRLEEQQMPLLTHRFLDEKQAEAEQRRMQILNQRMQSAKARQKLKKRGIRSSESNDFFMEGLHREPTTVEL